MVAKVAGHSGHHVKTFLVTSQRVLIEKSYMICQNNTDRKREIKNEANMYGNWERRCWIRLPRAMTAPEERVGTCKS